MSNLPKPYYESLEGDIYQGDALDILKTMPDKTVHCCVTSPPYWGLRDYGIDGQLGLEKTPEEYIEKMVQIFREVRRVLRSDGTLWLNLGDSYAGSGKGIGSEPDPKWEKARNDEMKSKTDWSNCGLKPKDLIGIPWRVALALQSDGWYLRSDIIWHKPNPMPESVQDRPTKSHEYLFLLTKSAKYYYDNEAIKEDFADERMGNPCGGGQYAVDAFTLLGTQKGLSKGKWNENKTASGRNKRSVWTIPTKPFSGAHFAVFPPALIEPCILAGTSEKGCCVGCGSPWERVVDKEMVFARRPWVDHKKRDPKTDLASWGSKYGSGSYNSKTIGWQPSCKCNADTKPCIVLDPFFGSGTTGVVAYKYGRNFVGIELSTTYLDEIAIPRIKKATEQLKLFT